MSERFKGQNVVIIGGNSGIGRSAARAFAAEGARVVITGRSRQTLDSVAAEIGPQCLALRSDIGVVSEIRDLFTRLRSELERIDVLFVNAGIGAFQPIDKVTEADWDSIHSINLKGVFFCVQQALPLLGKGSCIVLTGSIGALKGIPAGSVYAASKAGLRALGRSFAAELVGKGIRVNVVSPGPTETPIIGRSGLPPQAIGVLREQMIRNTPMHRMGTPEEVAAAVLFLASAESGFVTGIDFLIDGGAASF